MNIVTRRCKKWGDLPPANTPPNMCNIQHKFVDWVLWKEPECDVGISARRIIRRLADREVCCGWLVAAGRVEPLRGWCWSICNSEIPTGTLLVVLLVEWAKMNLQSSCAVSDVSDREACDEPRDGDHQLGMCNSHAKWHEREKSSGLHLEASVLMYR